MIKIYQDILKEFKHLDSDATVILYGSVASGKARPDSDIDIAVISDDKESKEKVDEIADKILFKYGKVVSVVFMKSDYVTKHSNYPFIREVLGGRVIHGRGEFSKVAG